MTAVITALNGASYTFVKVYDSNDLSDFNGTKTLAQIPIVATDSVALVGGKLQMGPTNLANGYAHNRATFAPVMKYGRIIAEFTVNAAYPGVFARQQGGYDYFSYPTAGAGVYVNLLGTSGVDKNRGLKSVNGGNQTISPVPPAGNLCRITLDLLPDVDNTTLVTVRWDDLTAGTFSTQSFINDTTIPPGGAGTWGVWNTSGTPQSAGTAYTRVAIYSAQGAADIAPSTPYLVIADGDSITQGTGTAPAPTDFSTADVTYPGQLSRLLPNLYTVMNMALSGQKSTDLLGFAPADITPKVNSAYSKVIVPILVGANDVGQNTDSAAVIYGRITALHAAVKATGALTIAIAPYHAQYPSGWPRAASDYNPTIDGIVALMAANWPSFADGFINPMTDARFADQTTNPLLADRLHINAAGGAYFAAQVQSVIQSLAPPAPPAAPASLSAAAPQASAVLTWPAAATANGYRVRKDGVTTPIYAGPLLTFTDTFALGTSHTYTVTAYNPAGESALTTPIPATAITTSLSLTVTPGTGVNTLAWISDPLAANGYAVLWMPGSALPVAGATGEVVARVAQGTLTWADTSAYRVGMAAGSRYDVISLR